MTGLAEAIANTVQAAQQHDSEVRHKYRRHRC